MNLGGFHSLLSSARLLPGSSLVTFCRCWTFLAVQNFTCHHRRHGPCCFAVGAARRYPILEKSSALGWPPHIKLYATSPYHNIVSLKFNLSGTTGPWQPPTPHQKIRVSPPRPPLPLPLPSPPPPPHTTARQEHLMIINMSSRQTGGILHSRFPL